MELVLGRLVVLLEDLTEDVKSEFLSLALFGIQVGLRNIWWVCKAFSTGVCHSFDTFPVCASSRRR